MGDVLTQRASTMLPMLTPAAASSPPAGAAGGIPQGTHNPLRWKSLLPAALIFKQRLQPVFTSRRDVVGSGGCRCLVCLLQSKPPVLTASYLILSYLGRQIFSYTV